MENQGSNLHLKMHEFEQKFFLGLNTIKKIKTYRSSAN